MRQETLNDFVWASTLIPPDLYDPLRQLRQATWDGNLMSKAARTRLVEMGLVVRYGGWQVVTGEGLKALVALRLIKC